MNNKKFYEDITIVIVGYKSTKKIIDFVKMIPIFFKIIIVDNSNDYEIKNQLSNFKNIDIFFKENNGVSSAINFASSQVKTNYFFQISPDLIFDFNELEFFYNKAKKINDKFSALGPRFINVDPKSHKQSNPNDELGYIKSIHGSAMFINKKNFDYVKGFDENIFLYFEETDYCIRCEKNNLKSYQLNTVKIKNNGRSVELKDEYEECKLQMLLSWHFIWSKYYCYNRHYNKLFIFLYFQLILIRSLIKMSLFFILRKKNKFDKYKYRINGLISSIIGKKSYLRIDKIL